MMLALALAQATSAAPAVVAVPEAAALAACAVERGSGDLRWIGVVRSGRSGVPADNAGKAVNNALMASFSGCEIKADADPAVAARDALAAVDSGVGSGANLPRRADPLADCLVRDAKLSAMLYLAVADRYGIDASAEAPKRLQAMSSMLSTACQPAFRAMGDKLDELELYSRLSWVLRAEPALRAIAPAP